ncbi:hypothetical protein BP6252_06051 [Coleophoma cylindrospora]|uniref:DUF676 domain-containing protein n=1 Tax=Coleophoma cylindrospora TaxID=1849047 RepID=A0A3D8RLJ6_9HELO|nr:hypothetical protein BP6252_06051 [Coleophoma cylindrospora]
MAEAASPDEDIYNITVECSSLFKYLVTSDILPKSEPEQVDPPNTLNPACAQDNQLEVQHGEANQGVSRARLEQMERRFDLWINYTGALAAVGRSLDDRLTGHVDIKEMVIELLQMLARNLQYIYAEDVDKSKPPSSLASIRDQTLKNDACAAAEQAIDDLHFMAAAIRRSSVQSVKYNLSSSFERDDELYFEGFATLLVKREFPNTRHSICEQLGASIAVRRKRLFRRKLHEEKLSTRRGKAPFGSRSAENATGAVAKPSLSPSQANVRPNPLPLQRLKGANKPTGSGDSRSRLESTAARNYLKGPSLSTVSMGSSVRNTTIDYPLKPKHSEDDKFCACPYCARPLEVKKLKKDKYWEDHVDEDVKPYVCLSEECTSPFMYFVHLSEWLHHMKEMHSEQWARNVHMTTWYCDVDHGEILQYNNYNDFVSHMMGPSNHPGRKPPTDLQLSALARNKQKVLVREDKFACPLCDCVPDSIEIVTLTRNSEDIYHILHKHIAKHLKTLAFISVPTLALTDQDQVEASIVDEKESERFRKEGSEASYPSGAFDLSIRAISLFNIEDPPSREHAEDITTDFYSISETLESHWDDIGFTDYEIVRKPVHEEEDLLLRHFARLQNAEAPFTRNLSDTMGTTIDLDEIKRFEITEVYAHPEAKVDIILVHGINGDPRKTWTAKNRVFWPTQLLPMSLGSAKARILVYGYNVDLYSFGGGMIHAHAQTLASNVAIERKSEEATEHPIIWVAHSLGGILVKRVLELSNNLMERHSEDYRSIFVATYGIIFLGTPHTGSDPAKWGLMIQTMVSTLVPQRGLDTPSRLVNSLQTNTENLENINLHFLDIYQRFRICMVHETVKTELKGTQSLVVDQISAGPMLPGVTYFGIEATHSGMCKFESRNSPGYLNISSTIKSWVVESPQLVNARFDIEKATRQQESETRAKELLGIFDRIQPQTDAGTTGGLDSRGGDLKEPHFITPVGFRTNTLFIGRQEELAQMHKLLFDEKRRTFGTSSVLIQNMPGGGKTHLARQYVFEHKNEFPGGIFWCRAKSLSELTFAYWGIMRQVISPEGSSGEDLSDQPDKFIEVVRQWFNRRQDWLLILDGIYLDEPETLQGYIPDSPNTCLIYTSTDVSIGNDYRFLNPQIIKLPLLSASEAQTLLLLELDKRNPTKAELSHSMELVQAMSFIPVVIHAVSQRLKATDEPLSRFARSYVSEPKLRGLGAYIAVVDHLKTLGAFEALNLLRITCFFSQVIPVRMLVLGCKILDVPIEASDPISGRNFNNTFKRLRSFALIDGSDSSLDVPNLDVIRLTSVVQSFFIDTLLGEGTLPLWIDRAVKLFFGSHHTASTRKTNPSLIVDDNRQYEIQGLRLREHITKHIKRWKILGDTLALLDSRLEDIKDEIEQGEIEQGEIEQGEIEQGEIEQDEIEHGEIEHGEIEQDECVYTSSDGSSSDFSLSE